MFDIGMFTSGYDRNPIEDIFVDANRFGYDYVELYGSRPHAYSLDIVKYGADDILNLAKKHDVWIKGYTPEHNGYGYNFMIGPEYQRQDCIDYLKLSLDAASKLGAEFMLISPAHAGYNATHTQMLKRLVKTVDELGEYAAKKQIKLVVEPLTTCETNVLKSAADLHEMFEYTKDNDYVVGMCDIVPPFQQQEQIMSYFDILGDKMYHMHIIDSDGSSDAHVMPGEGVLPMYELMQELKAYPYEGAATIELVTGYINEPRLYARRAIDNVKEMLK